MALALSGLLLGNAGLVSRGDGAGNARIGSHDSHEAIAHRHRVPIWMSYQRVSGLRLKYAQFTSMASQLLTSIPLTASF